MLIKLTIAANSKKSQNLQKDTINVDVEDSKQGIISNGCCCSCLNQTDPNLILKCCTCDELYHPECIKRTVPASTVQILNESPNCWWTCLHCVTNLPVVNGTQNVSTQQAALDSLKDSLLSEICQLINPLNPLISHERHRDHLKRKRDDIHDDVASKQRKTLSESTPSISKDAVITSHNLIQQNIDDIDSVIDVARHNPTSLTNNTNHIQHSTVPTFTAQGSSTRSIQQRLQNIAEQPSSEVNKFILHYKPISQDLALKSHEEWHETRRAIGKMLQSIQISFSKFNLKNGRVKIGFPTQYYMDKAKALIDSSPSTGLWSYENYEPALLLPKLTIYNIPLDFDIPADKTGDMSAVEYRDAVKSQLVETIREKNEAIKSLMDTNESILEVVYVQKHKTTCTAALKVSPILRDHIVNACNSKLYVFSSRCRVEDRFFYHQCFHCQAVGHMSKSCSKINEDPVCMYCSRRHMSRDCPVKKHKSNHCCANCLNSSDTFLSANASTHNAASQFCPITVSYINDHVKSRIHINDAKNVINC